MDRSQIPLTLPLLLAAAVAIAADSKPPSTEDAQVAHLKDAKWAAPKLKEIPPGVMSSPIAGDPTSGGSVGYAKYTPGYVFPMHWHSATEYTTILHRHGWEAVRPGARELHRHSSEDPPPVHLSPRCRVRGNDPAGRAD
jgi:hypothetical protein